MRNLTTSTYEPYITINCRQFPLLCSQVSMEYLHRRHFLPTSTARETSASIINGRCTEQDALFSVWIQTLQGTVVKPWLLSTTGKIHFGVSHKPTSSRFNDKGCNLLLRELFRFVFHERSHYKLSRQGSVQHVILLRRTNSNVEIQLTQYFLYSIIMGRQWKPKMKVIIHVFIT